MERKVKSKQRERVKRKEKRYFTKTKRIVRGRKRAEERLIKRKKGCMSVFVFVRSKRQTQTKSLCLHPLLHPPTWRHHMRKHAHVITRESHDQSFARADAAQFLCALRVCVLPKFPRCHVSVHARACRHAIARTERRKYLHSLLSRESSAAILLKRTLRNSLPRK